jgi:secondary thiamine-phosphate synthase enzyme
MKSEGRRAKSEGYRRLFALRSSLFVFLSEMEKFTVKTTKAKQVVDITEVTNRMLRKLGATNGVCYLFIIHTTAALTTADLDPGTDLDMLDAFEAMIPKLRYRHPHDPSHVPDHILSSLIGASVMAPVKNGALWLGTWQRVVLVELDGPRDREIVWSFIPEARERMKDEG